MDLYSFYKDKNLLLTGCTGFLGKVILCKVLTSLPTVGKIYLLVRQKRGVSPEERLKKIFASYAFIQFKRQFADDDRFQEFLSEKIVLINGDLTLEHLGISESDRKKVT